MLRAKSDPLGACGSWLPPLCLCDRLSWTLELCGGSAEGGEMSWQEYIDDHLLAELPHGGTLEHAAIASLEGDIWAQSPNFPELSEEEAKAINTGFDNQNELASKGLFLGGQKFIVLAGDEGAVIRGKSGSQGITIKKTNTAMVVGIYNSSVSTGDANTVVENLGDYLIEQEI